MRVSTYHSFSVPVRGSVGCLMGATVIFAFDEFRCLLVSVLMFNSIWVRWHHFGPYHAPPVSGYILYLNLFMRKLCFTLSSSALFLCHFLNNWQLTLRSQRSVPSRRVPRKICSHVDYVSLHSPRELTQCFRFLGL